MPDKEGTYEVQVRAALKNGAAQILTKTIDVKTQPFDVVRHAPSRVFPNSSYAVDLKVTANTDFDGVVSEYIPKALEVAFPDASKILSVATESSYLSDVTPVHPFDFKLGKPFNGDYVVTQGFAEKELDYTDFGLNAHDGVDFGLSAGTPLRSADSGTVTHAAANPYGNTVIIEHSWGRTFYGHLSSFYVAERQKVAKGDIIGFIDAGMDINPKGISMLLEHFYWYDADIVVGSKLHPVSKVNYPNSRRILSRGYRFLTRVLFGFKVRDTQVGLKLFKRDVVKKVLPKLLVKKYAFDIEFLAVAYRKGFTRIYEAPVEITFNNASNITSKSFWRIVGRMVWDTAAVFYRLKILHYYD
jgi:murein DD-endopeptidase MepM/ murein hydrolase activator NlpD